VIGPGMWDQEDENEEEEEGEYLVRVMKLG
jgi:hypothetical protein